jgi:hypothetical protein
MIGSTKKRLFLWVNQSNGDSLGTIPVIENFIKKYPNVEITFGCWEHHSYLFQHFPIKILKFGYDYRLGRSLRFDWYTPEDHIPIYLWLGNYPNELGNNFHWKNCIINFNNQCRDKNLDFKLDYDCPGYINLPNVEVSISNNSILVENGPPDTNSNRFHFDIMQIASKFPDISFYCTGNTNCSLPNVFDLSMHNLIIVQNVLKKCKMFIGRGSGPAFLTAHEDCKNLVKGIFGDYSVFGKIWDPNDKNWYYNEGSTEAIIKFIEDKFNYE